MTRLLWSAALLVLACAPLAHADDKRPPNILFCFADDWGRYASAYAAIEKHASPNQVVKTPNVDRVAREGVLFRNAFVNAPSCTPCRSLLSGRYFFNTGRGAILQTAQWDSKIPSFPLLLKDAGYHVGKSYKVWSPGTPVDAPFGGQKYAYEKAGRRANKFSTNVTQMMQEGETLEVARDDVFAEVRDNFTAFLAGAKKIQPWLYWFGPTNTHRLWVKGSGKALWKIDPDSLKGKLPSFLPDVPEVREDFADYLGEVQAFDAYVGVLLKKLEQTKQLDNTVVVLSGDHGPPGFTHGKCNLYDFGVAVTLAVRWPGGKRGRVVDDFVNLMDLAPTFITIGGAKMPKSLDGKSLVNVLKSDKSGQVDPTRTFVITGRERRVAAARKGNVPYPHRALRTKDFLYVRNFEPTRWPMGDPRRVSADKAPTAKQLETDTLVTFEDMDAGPTKAWLVAHRNEAKWKPFYELAFARRPAEELYDLRKDRDQVKNVADSADYAEDKKKLAKQLMGVLKKAGDPRVTGDGKTFEKAPFTDPVTPVKKQK